MANLLTKLTEVGAHIGVERGTMQPTEWSAAIKKKLGRENVDIGDLYKELKDGKLKKPDTPAAAKPIAKPVDAKPVPKAEVSSPVHVEVLPAANHRTEVDARHAVAFHLPAITIKRDAPAFDGGEATVLTVVTGVVNWFQPLTIGLLAGILFGAKLAKAFGGL